MKLLFFSPYTLLDSSSGAALCVSALMAELVRQGHTCVAATGAVVDAKNQLFDRVLKTKPVTTYTVENNNTMLPVRHINFNGVPHYVIGEAKRAEDLRAMEEVALRKFFLDGFTQLGPDALLTYGGFTSNYYAGQYAMTKGVKSVLYAASDHYARGNAYQLDHVNMIHTVSGALRAKLAEASGLPIIATKTFVRRADVVCAQRTPHYITFFNPIPSKGLKIAALLARECWRRKKPYKFLFVEARGTREQIFAACPDLREIGNVDIATNTTDVRKIYERTALCLYPSVWFEAAGRVPIEANANGIPVLACDMGGIAEMLDGAGFLFDPPTETRQNYMADVPAAYVDQWIEVIDRLHDDQAFIDDAVRRAKAADARYDTAKMAQALADALTAQA